MLLFFSFAVRISVASGYHPEGRGRDGVHLFAAKEDGIYVSCRGEGIIFQDSRKHIPYFTPGVLQPTRSVPELGLTGNLLVRLDLFWRVSSDRRFA